MTKSKRWKPKEGDSLYMVTMFMNFDTGESHVDVCKHIESIGSTYDPDQYLDIRFRTKKEAQAVARKLKAFWKDVREER